MWVAEEEELSRMVSILQDTGMHYQACI
jgi:hypothetical protein